MDKKILIVEDDAFMRDVVANQLEKGGYAALLAENGQEGLKLLKQEKPLLVLLDMVMPEMDGYEFLEHAKKDPDVANIPILALTNLGQQDEIQRGLSLGAEEYLIKSNTDLNELVPKINEIVNKYYQ